VINSAVPDTNRQQGANRRSTKRMIETAPMVCRNYPKMGKHPPFPCTKGGRGGAGPDPHTNHSRNFRLEDPPQFFGQIFWEKILEITIVLLVSPRRRCYASSRSDSAAIGVVLHRWSLSSSRPTPQRLLPRPPASLRYILHSGWAAMPRLPANHP
jgi:hypothetical protein